MKYGCRVVPEDEAGRRGSKGAREGPSELRGCQCILRLGTPGMQTDGRTDGGRRQTTGERGAGFSFSNTDIEICIATVVVVVWTVILHSRSECGQNMQVAKRCGRRTLVVGQNGKDFSFRAK